MEDPHTSSSATHAARSAETLRALEERARAALATQRERTSRLEQQLTGQLDALAETLSEQMAEQASAEIAQLRQELDEAQTAWNQQQSEQAAELADLAQQLDTRSDELDQRAAKLDQESEELNSHAAALDEREAHLTTRDQELAARDQELAEREQAIESADAQAEADRRARAEGREAWDAERAALEQARDELAAALAEASARLESAQQQAEGASEKESLQQKFELALEDVHRLRARAAELEQELARRPEAEETDSAELVHLRAERDALAERVEQLEQAPGEQLDADAERHLADLQRRFELAVEDVRDLRKKNAQLEAQLTEAAKKVVGSTDSGAMDWESQKQRLLASLADDGNSGDSARQKERATIEGTIRITDEVVAGKDEEIAKLRQQMASLQGAGGKVGIDRQRELALNRLVDEDEVIQQHRKRIAQLEREMEDKLRAAELELSVERAKLAREQAGLADARLEWEAMRKSHESGGEQVAAGTPKRRWLSKLGLSSDEEKK